MFFHWFEHSQIFHPSRTMDVTGKEIGRPFEDVFFKASDGVELNGWYFAAHPASPRAEFAVLFCHGNGGNISHRLKIYQALLETGVSVFAFDYRGYGRSHGQPSERGTYLDAQAAYAWLRKKGFSATRIIVYGESLGGGIASELCVREPTGALILQGTFTSIPDIGAQLYPWLPVKLISRIKYDTHSRLPALKIPVMVMHSRRDGLILFSHSERNLAAANEPKMFCELDGDHNHPLENRAGFMQGLEKFLRLVERLKTSAAKPAK